MAKYFFPYRLTLHLCGCSGCGLLDEYEGRVQRGEMRSDPNQLKALEPIQELYERALEMGGRRSISSSSASGGSSTDSASSVGGFFF